MNKSNIGDLVMVDSPDKKTFGNGELGKITKIELIGDEIFYTISLLNGFDNGGNLPVQYIQIKEGHYIK